jgi:tetratricopeptide (TPR) repeat protein
MKDKILTTLLAILLISPVIHADTEQIDSLVLQADKAYNESRFEESIELYLQVVEMDYESADLYYNIGNSYFKLNKIPYAVLYYEKAKKLDPGNEDIEFNLNLANSRVIDKIEAIPELFYVTWWKNIRNLLDTDGWAKAGIIAFILFWIVALVFFFAKSILLRKASFWSGIITILIAAGSFTMAAQSHHSLTRQKEAVIFTPTLTVKSSPNENSVDLFVIHEGTKVRITDNVEGWSEIVIANGSKGWVKDNSFKII